MRSLPIEEPRPVQATPGLSILSPEAFLRYVAVQLELAAPPETSEARLNEDLGFDSLRMFELALVLEALEAQVAAEEIGRLRTMGDAYKLYTERRLREPRGVAATEEPLHGSRPTLVGRHTAQRPVVPADYPYLYALTNADGVAGLWRHRGESVNPEQFAAVLWNTVLVQHLVLEVGSSAPIGLVAAYQADLRNGTAFMAMALDPRVHRKGWTFEAAGLFINFLFGMWPLRKLYFEALTPVAETVGTGIGRLFVEEGRLRSHEFVNGEWRDMQILALHRERWDALAPRFVGRIAGSGTTDGTRESGPVVPYDRSRGWGR